MSNLTEAAAGNGAGSGRYAIVGYGFRMPGGIYTAGDFWQLLSRRGFIREPVAARYGLGYEPVLEDPRAEPLRGQLRGADGLKVAEFTHSVRPDDTAAAGYLRNAPDGPQPEFWLAGASEEDTKRLYEAFGAGEAAGPAVRFATADLSEPASVDLARGLLRAAACDLVVLDAAAAGITAATSDLIRRLLVPGGLALVRHPEAGFTRPGRDWSQAAEDGSLWAAPTMLADDGPAPRPALGDRRPGLARRAAGRPARRPPALAVREHLGGPLRGRAASRPARRGRRGRFWAAAAAGGGRCPGRASRTSSCFRTPSASWRAGAPAGSPCPRTSSARCS